SRPSILKPEKRGSPSLQTGSPPRAGSSRPGPVKRPAPAKPAASASAASDFDWDDDELETKLFDEGVKAPVESAPQSVSVAPVARAATPVATAAPSRPSASPVAAAAPAAAAAAVAATPNPTPTFTPQQTSVDLDDDEDIPPGTIVLPVIGRKPIALVAGVAGGIVVLLIILIMIFSGGDDPAESDTAAPVETADKAVVAAPGTLTVDVTPADAKVEVDGKEIAGASPRVIANLDSSKKHKLVVSMGETYLPYEQEVEVPSGSSMNLPVKLDIKEVTLTVETEPKNAKVALVTGDDVEAKGKGSESFKLTREPGVTYKLEGSLKGYKTDRVPIAFDGTAAQTVKLALVRDGAAPKTDDPPKKKVKKPSTPSKPKTATLRIAGAAGFPPATVWVDGRKQSKKTPVQVKVSSGSHRVKWKWPNGKTANKNVSVKDKQAVVVKP
ncbi:MAG: PEGA domain-containing protein, partial [Nannocystaceae bacterium]